MEEALLLLAQTQGFELTPRSARRPDGQVVPIDWDAPLRTFGRLVQEDLCLHLKSGEEHVLAAAVLCFPASWSLAEKLGRPLSGVHLPVEEYDSDLQKRVQRLFDGLKPGTVLRRANCLAYDGFELLRRGQRQIDEIFRQAGPRVLSERNGNACSSCLGHKLLRFQSTPAL